MVAVVTFPKVGILCPIVQETRRVGGRGLEGVHAGSREPAGVPRRPDVTVGGRELGVLFDEIAVAEK